MNKIVTWFLCCVFTTLCFTTNAQEEYVNPEWKHNGDVQLGVAIGATNSVLRLTNDTSNPSSDEYASAYTVGLRLDYFFNRNWSIKVMPSYDVRSWRVPFFSSVDYKYLTIPVLANWHFGKNRRWNLHFGPHYSAALDSPSPGSSFGFDLGIGIIIPISSMRFFIELDAISDFKNSEITFTDINGNPAGSGGVHWQRSSINFGVVF